jgi:hypothetical protein
MVAPDATIELPHPRRRTTVESVPKQLAPGDEDREGHSTDLVLADRVGATAGPRLMIRLMMCR